MPKDDRDLSAVPREAFLDSKLLDEVPEGFVEDKFYLIDSVAKRCGVIQPETFRAVACFLLNSALLAFMLNDVFTSLGQSRSTESGRFVSRGFVFKPIWSNNCKPCTISCGVKVLGLIHDVPGTCWASA